jgi:hypothetical protein
MRSFEKVQDFSQPNHNVKSSQIFDCFTHIDASCHCRHHFNAFGVTLQAHILAEDPRDTASFLAPKSTHHQKCTNLALPSKSVARVALVLFLRTLPSDTDL